LLGGLAASAAHNAQEARNAFNIFSFLKIYGEKAFVMFGIYGATNPQSC
jgi:hypothetical protein